MELVSRPGLTDRRRALEEEALPHLDSLYRYALRLAGDTTLAEDLVQDTILKAFRSWSNYRPGTNARAWLFTILRNTLISQYRRRRHHAENVDISEVDGYTVFDEVRAPDPDERFFAQLVDGEVIQAIDSLPGDYREVLMLSDVEELTYEEIADIVEVPIGTVKSRLHRARRLLQRLLYDYAVEMGYIETDHACCVGAA